MKNIKDRFRNNIISKEKQKIVKGGDDGSAAAAAGAAAAAAANLNVPSENTSQGRLGHF